jgi:hypothetical protein
MTTAPDPLDPAVAALAATPFISSWIGRARPGDLHDPDAARRTAAWAHWFYASLSPMSGVADRPYTGVILPGQFYDPRGNGPKVRPHLEVPAYRFDRPDDQFPDRLAQIGSGLLFPWWLMPEVAAVKRALFSTPRQTPTELIDLLNTRRGSMLLALTQLKDSAARIWSDVEEALVADPEQVTHLTSGNFALEDVAAYWAPAKDLGLRIEFDPKLAETSGKRVSRRVGVWRLICENDDGTAILGTVTPRLTRSSLFTDPLFEPEKEAPAALLVRGLVLRRLISAFDAAAAGVDVGLEPAAAKPAGSGLRAVVAKVGEKLPEASTRAALRFLREHPDATDAWEALHAWASGRGTAAEPRRAALTVTQDGFTAAHRSAVRSAARAEDPDREDINVILPLAWDVKNQIVRVTYAPRGGSDTP